MKGKVVALLVLLAVAGAVYAGPHQKPDPLPPLPTEGISCLSVEIDGSQLYHQDFEKPIHTWGELKGQAVRFAKDLQLRGAITHEERIKQDGDRILAVAEGKSAGGSYEVGNVCYVLMRYCAPGCTGQWCVTVRVPSVQ